VPVPSTQDDLPSLVKSPSGAPVAFRFEGVAGQPAVASVELRGRSTLVALIASHDASSQAQLKALGIVLRQHVPRINALAVALEPRQNRPLLEALVTTLAPPFAVVQADDETIAGRGPWKGLHHVPSVVLLDAEGRERWRHIGLADPQVMERALVELERR
jgi:hypothetical protein